MALEGARGSLDVSAETHEEMRALLPGYAAGTLNDAESGAVREHLAAGCLDCLRDVFSRPVGLPLGPGPAGVRPAARHRTVGQPLAIVAVLSLVLISVAASMIAERRSRNLRSGEEAAEPGPGLDEIEQLRTSLALRLDALERAAVSGEIASREAGDARSAMASAERELEAARLRIGSLKRAMRRQDADFREKRKSMEAVLARLTEPLPSAGEDRDVAGCDRAPERAREVCTAFCDVQGCASTSGPECDLLRARYQGLTGASIPPCTVARATNALVPCEKSRLDVWSFAVKQGHRYTLRADTVEAATAADLCLVGWCRGADAFAGDDEVPCRAPGFGCPRTTFVAAADATCVAAVTICSPGCQDPRSARYEVTVDGAESLSLLADDVSSVTAEHDDS